MVNPINYALGGPDPVTQLFQGVGEGIGIRQTEQQMDLADEENRRADERLELQKQQAATSAANAAAASARADEQLAMQRQRMAMEQQRMDRAQEFEVAMGQLAIKGVDATSEDYKAVASQFPEFAAGVMETFDGMSEARQQGTVTRLMQIGSALQMGQTDIAIDLAMEYAEAAENSGDPAAAATARAMVETMKESPEAALSAVGLTIATIDPKGADTIFPARGAPQRTDPVGDGSVAVIYDSTGIRHIDTATGETIPADQVPERRRQAENRMIEIEREKNRARAQGGAEVRLDTAEDIAAATARGTQIGQTEAERFLASGSDLEKAETSLNLIRALKEDEGLPSVVGGLQGRLPPGIPGVTGGEKGTGAFALIQQIQGSVFLRAFDSLRGGGPITQIEGEKAELAMARLNRAQSEEDFIDALTELEEVYAEAVSIAQRNQGLTPSSSVIGGDISENKSFTQRMYEKWERGESFTPEEEARLRGISGR